jgi:hypothetical protein
LFIIILSGVPTKAGTIYAVEAGGQMGGKVNITYLFTYSMQQITS